MSTFSRQHGQVGNGTESGNLDQTKGNAMNEICRMNRRELMQVIVVAPAAVVGSGADSQLSKKQSTRFASEFLRAWQISREVTLEFARAMPDEHYGFRPTPEIWTFAEQLAHIAETNITWIARFVKGEKPPINNFKATQTKVQIVQLLEQSFDYVARIAPTLNDRQIAATFEFERQRYSVDQFFWYVRDHVTHHRGQLVIYFRLKGMVPPRYRA
jgi:uncharacterized damage-inducible protein DinB